MRMTKCGKCGRLYDLSAYDDDYEGPCECGATISASRDIVEENPSDWSRVYYLVVLIVLALFLVGVLVDLFGLNH